MGWHNIPLLIHVVFHNFSRFTMILLTQTTDGYSIIIAF